MSNLGGANLGGGPFNGYSPQQTISSVKDSQQVSTRSILRRSWNGQFATGVSNGRNRITTPFRAVNNSGDFLGRVNYSCGGPNPTNLDKPGRGQSIGSVPQQCDGTGVPASSCNVRFVADSSDYVRFRRQQAVNRTYNDLSYGGDDSNASYVPLMAVRRGRQ
jgi:hypothetical protein